MLVVPCVKIGDLPKDLKDDKDVKRSRLTRGSWDSACEMDGHKKCNSVNN